MALRTRVTEILGIKYPIIQGGMQYVSYAELTAAISNGGGLGILSALTQPTPDALRAEIKRCQRMTDRPFGVNLTILPTITPPPYLEYAQAIVDEGVKVVETAGNSPRDFIELFKAAGVTVIHKCTSIRHAISAEKMGVDIISMDGFECAGHPGEDDITNMILLPRAAQVLKIPFLASGGIADGRGLAAALAMGAEGVSLGTRFMCTLEAPIHQNVKNAIVNASELSTTLIFRPFRNSSRVYKNNVTMEVNRREAVPNATFEDVRELVAGSRGRKVYSTGDPEYGAWTAGMVMGLIHDIPSCAALVERIAKEAQDIIQYRLMSILDSSVDEDRYRETVTLEEVKARL